MIEKFNFAQTICYMPKTRKPDNDFKAKAFWILFLSFPVVLALVLRIADSVSQERQRREWENRQPGKSYYELMTPEERHRLGLDRLQRDQPVFIPPADARERIHKVLLEGSEENRLIEKLSKEDYKDFYDYYDGPEGNLSHIDFHDIEDYFGGSND